MSALFSIAQMISPAAPTSVTPAPSNAPPSGQPTFSDTLQRQHEPAAQPGKPATQGEKVPAKAEGIPAKPVDDKSQAESKEAGNESAAAENAAGGAALPIPVAPALTLQQQALEIARESAAFRRSAQIAGASVADEGADGGHTLQGERARSTQALPLGGAGRAAAEAAQTNVAYPSDAALPGPALLATLTGAGAAAGGALSGTADGKPGTTALAGTTADRGARIVQGEPALKLAGDTRRTGARSDTAIAGADALTPDPGDARHAAIAALSETTDRIGVRQTPPDVQLSVAQPTLGSLPAQFIPAAPVAAAPALHVATPFGAAEWGDAFGQQVAQLTMNRRTGMQTAELRLDPPDLGPIRVTLTIQDGTAHAAFSSAHGAVRQAIEASMPQLQQALSQSGIALGQSQVNDQGQPSTFDNAFAQSQHNDGANAGNGAPGNGGGNAAGDETIAVALSSRAPRSLVDTFA